MKYSITYKQIIISDPMYNKMLRMRRERIWIPKKMMLSSTFEADEQKSVFFGAFLNTRRLIGCVALTPDTINKWTLLRQLAVDERYCGLGIGRHLIQIAEEYVSENQWQHIVLFSDEETKTYFEKAGYFSSSGWYSHSNGMRSIMMCKKDIAE